MLRRLRATVEAAVSGIDSDSLRSLARNSLRRKGQDGANSTRTRLFHCSVCETVFIAVEMHACPRCDAAVEAVPATLR